MRRIIINFYFVDTQYMLPPIDDDVNLQPLLGISIVFTLGLIGTLFI